MSRAVLVALSALGLVFVSQASLAQSVYEDGTFDLTDWSEYGPFLSPGDLMGQGDVTSSQILSGGNPGEHLRFEVVGASVPMGTATSVWGILINDTQVYDPAAAGAIDRIDFNFDARRMPGSAGSRVVTLAVQQDGYRWAAIADRAFTASDVWLPALISDLSAADFSPHIWGETGQPPIALIIPPSPQKLSHRAIPLTVRENLDSWNDSRL